MPTKSPALPGIIGQLRAHYGALTPPPARTAFELVVWEKVAYLATDERRQHAFERLKRSVGVTPRAILAASRTTIMETLASGGINAPERTNNLIAAAELVVGEFDGSLDDVCRRPLAEAKKQLMRFHGIGEPGAEKILLLTRTHAVLGLDSNGLRVLTRLGVGSTAKSYSATYRSATASALTALGSNVETLVEAHLALRHHGQTVCKTSVPKCGACVVRARCPSARP